MKHQLAKIFAALLMTSIAQVALAQKSDARLCPSPWKSQSKKSSDCSLDEHKLTSTYGWTKISKTVKAKIRSGYLAENPNVAFKGNIIYYQGLGDSMLNHMPLFSKLTNAGFRVISFDYMGQGGSSGTMNDTRLAEIGNLGNKIWKQHAKDLKNFPKKNIIGWSTGGLVAYLQARTSEDVNNIVLIAPGIAPNVTVGEQKLLEFKFNQITLPTLTTQIYTAGVENPHIDAIKPTSPFEVLDFAMDLLVTSKVNQHPSMNTQVNGFVLISGDNDTYVNAEKTFEVLAKTAPHFFAKQYANTLHEIDNEAAPQGPAARADILEFLQTHN